MWLSVYVCILNLILLNVRISSLSLTSIIWVRSSSILNNISSSLLRRLEIIVVYDFSYSLFDPLEDLAGVENDFKGHGWV